MFDAWAGLLISHPHHQLSAAPSVSQITEFVVVVWPEDEKGGGVTFPSGLTSSTSAHILVLIRTSAGGGLFNKFVCEYVRYNLHLDVCILAHMSLLSLCVCGCDLSALLC